MLGTNDLKQRFQVPPVEIGESVRLLLRLIRHSYTGPGGGAPRMLLVAPPPVLEAGLSRRDLRRRGGEVAAAGRGLCADRARGTARRSSTPGR